MQPTKSASKGPLYNKKLDAGQCSTLARPAAPLAACVQRISSVDKTNKKQ